jgi:hypothetical protein
LKNDGLPYLKNVGIGAPLGTTDPTAPIVIGGGDEPEPDEGIEVPIEQGTTVLNFEISDGYELDWIKINGWVISVDGTWYDLPVASFCATYTEDGVQLELANITETLDVRIKTRPVSTEPPPPPVNPPPTPENPAPQPQTPPQTSNGDNSNKTNMTPFIVGMCVGALILIGGGVLTFWLLKRKNDGTKHDGNEKEIIVLTGKTTKTRAK